MAGGRKWSDLTPRQRGAVVVLGAVEVVLTTIALRDLARRDAAEVRGPKLLWRAACLVQPFGPVSYLVLGRRRAETP
jgi:hypothetical protein